MNSRPARPNEKNARLRALDAARESIASGVSAAAMAEKHRVPRGTVQQGVLVIKLGLPDDVARLESGDVSWDGLYRSTIARMTKAQIEDHRRSLISRPRPRQYHDQRMKALVAAEAVRDERISYDDAALREGVTASTVGDAYICLTEGTPEQIEKLRSGAVSLRAVYKEILGRADRQMIRKDVTRSTSTKQQEAMESAIWERLRSALASLGDLPTPADVVAIGKRNGRRRIAIDRMLMNSFTWITEFADAWTK